MEVAHLTHIRQISCLHLNCRGFIDVHWCINALIYSNIVFNMQLKQDVLVRQHGPSRVIPVKGSRSHFGQRWCYQKEIGPMNMHNGYGYCTLYRSKATNKLFILLSGVNKKADIQKHRLAYRSKSTSPDNATRAEKHENTPKYPHSRVLSPHGCGRRTYT